MIKLIMTITVAILVVVLFYDYIEGKMFKFDKELFDTLDNVGSEGEENV